MDKLSAKKRWINDFKVCIECDSWGQTLEAIDQYNACAYHDLIKIFSLNNLIEKNLVTIGSTLTSHDTVYILI